MAELRHGDGRCEGVTAQSQRATEPGSQLQVVGEIVQLPCLPALRLIDNERIGFQAGNRRKDESTLYHSVPLLAPSTPVPCYSGRQSNLTPTTINQKRGIPKRTLHARRGIQPFLRAGHQFSGSAPSTLRIARDQVDHTTERVRAEEGGLWAFHNFDTLQHTDRDARQVET